MELFVARQPILDAARRVIGYELLLRGPGPAESARPLSATTVAEALLSVGLDALVGDHLAFVNVEDPDTVEDFAGLLPHGRIVLEIDAAWPADAAQLAKYRGLRRGGYALAADRFPRDAGLIALLTEFDFVKIEAGVGDAGAPRGPLPPMIGRAKRVALGVNTPEDLSVAMRERFSLYQGRCFGRAASRTARALPASQWNNLNALAVVSRPEVSIVELEQVVRADAALSLRLLRTANSAAIANRSAVHTIREALVLLGIDVVRHWLALSVVRALGKGAHSELLATATIRAHCCDALASTSGDEGGFLVGLCSPLDQILEQPMEAVLQHIPLASDARAALLGEGNRLRHVLEAVIAYERGAFELCRAESACIGADVRVLPQAYAKALRWRATMRG